MKTAKIFSKIPKAILKEFIHTLTFPNTKKRQRLNSLAQIIFDQLNSPNEISFSLINSELSDTRNESNLRKDLNELINLLLDFLSIDQLRKKPTLKANLIQEAINNYNLSEIAKSHYIQVKESLKENITIDNDLHAEKTKFQRRSIDPVNNIGINEKDTLMTTVVSLQNELTNQYIIDSLKLKHLYHANTISPHQPDERFSWQKSLQNSIGRSDLQLLYKLSLDFIDENYRDFSLGERIVKELEKIKDLSIKEFKILYVNLINVFVWENNKGNRVYDNLHFKMHQLAIKHKVYGERIETYLYREIILYACKSKEFEWALEFSENYKSKLPKEDQETAYSFNKARIYINMKKYEDVIATLRDVEYKDITYNLNSKLMLMVSFYELNEYETLLSTIRAFKVFLRRRRNVSVARKANFTDFCDALYNIMLAEQNRDVKRIRKAKEILDGNPAIPNSTLLKEKMEELKL